MRWLALGLAALAGCSSKSNLDVTWTFSDLGSPPTALECSQRGVTSIRVQAVEADVTVLAPCAGGKTTLALEPRAYTVVVVGRSPGGGTILDPRPDDGTMPPGFSHIAYATAQPSRAPGSVAVKFRTLPRCANGIDDDQDGATDLNDPDCCSSLDDAEGTPRATPCPGRGVPDGGATDGPPARDAGAADAARPDAARPDAPAQDAATDAAPADAAPTAG